MSQNLFTITLTVLLVASAGTVRSDDRERATAPYPPSAVISGIHWASKTSIVRLANGSDNFPLTWADDDQLYTTWGDGNGFSMLPRRSMGFARVEGLPPKHRGIDIRSAQETLGSGRRGKKGWGLLCVDGVLYLWMGHADERGGQAQLAWPGSNLSLCTSGSMMNGKRWIEKPSWTISPYVISGSTYARSVTMPRRLELALKDLADIKSVRCSVGSP